MTAVDHAELKRLSDALRVSWSDRGWTPAKKIDALLKESRQAADGLDALLSEIEGLKADRERVAGNSLWWEKVIGGTHEPSGEVRSIKHLHPAMVKPIYDAHKGTAVADVIAGLIFSLAITENREQFLVADANERRSKAEQELDALRTQAPDSWRPTEQEVETVLRCCDAMERSVERKGLPKSEADICVATDWLRKVCAALRPQTAESGK